MRLRPVNGAVRNKQNGLSFYFFLLAVYLIGTLRAKHQMKQMLTSAMLGIINRIAVRKGHVMHIDIAYVEIAEREFRYVFVKNRNHLLFKVLSYYITVLRRCQQNRIILFLS